MLEKRLSKDSELKRDYTQFMEEYKDLNHMSECHETEDDFVEGYYLPHHAIIKTSSITTKCKVVFDASCRTDSGLSLNDVQFSGPALQADIFDILLRFRKYKYVLTADISKMYRQIMIEPSQRKYQKIFWRKDTKDELKCFELCTLTYGNTSSPYLAIRCLIQIAKENQNLFPETSSIIAHDFYMDDLLTGADSLSEISKIQRELSEILSRYGLDLRKWLCNEPTILKDFMIREDLEAGILELGENENNKTLGIYWNANYDYMQYSIRSFQNKELTKRNILSIICQIYDPLGLIGPVVIIAKLVMQSLWKLKVDWDSSIPFNIQESWIRFQKELGSLNELKIPRFCMLSEYLTVELHGFSDASEKAYGSCIYLRTFSQNKGFSSCLLCAKSRIAPVKSISLPRLELCGAVLLAQLANQVNTSLNIKLNAKYYWTDSTITLAWLQKEPIQWKTFVANRVSEIQSITAVDHWHHVKSKENPADLLSRGLSPSLIHASNLWWHGLEWLLTDSSDWDITKFEWENEIPEQRSISQVFITVDEDNFVLSLINKISSFQTLQRIVAYILRILNNIKCAVQGRKGGKETGEFGVLTPVELENAELLIIKLVQINCFTEEYNALLKSKDIPSRSSLLTLKPFIHEGIIRVGGRLQNAKISFDKKHQIILPKGNRLTEMIVRFEHERLLHCGVQNLICNIRDKFWPLSVRSTCKKVIRNCIRCFKAKPLDATYLMGNLPEFRLTENCVFKNVGVDYGGPFIIKDRKTRGAKTSKAYMCLFICMASKAVHLELVSELTTTAFLATLKRFIARRGKPSNIFSDNGLNFVGANRELQELYDFLVTENDSFSIELAKDRIKWNFIPARSPTFGGIWEAGIKSTKYHLKRVVGNTVLTFEELCTLLAQIECILNSRPICPLSSDPDDLTALTPAHLLMGRPLNTLPEINVMDVPENRLSQYQKLQSISQHFWTRWHKEYLAELQTRIKWKKQATNLLKIGCLVLVKEDHVPSYCWPLGRVVTVYPGKDKIIRVIDIQTQRGIVKRAVNKVCALPVE